jgi:hypothetical protein
VVFEVMCLFTLNGHYSGRDKLAKIFFGPNRNNGLGLRKKHAPLS